MKWISCKVIKAPTTADDEYFAPVLFYVPKGRGAGVCSGRYFPSRKKWVSLQGATFTQRRVTHWMHMPDAPHGDNEGQHGR